MSMAATLEPDTNVRGNGDLHHGCQCDHTGTGATPPAPTERRTAEPPNPGVRRGAQTRSETAAPAQRSGLPPHTAPRADRHPYRAGTGRLCTQRRLIEPEADHLGYPFHIDIVGKHSDTSSQGDSDD